MIEPLFEKERYIVTYNPSKGKVCALLKDQAKSDDILRAAFHAHLLLHFIRSSLAKQSLRKDSISSSLNSNKSLSTHLMPTLVDYSAHIAESCKIVLTTYGIFKQKAAEQGWVMSESLLNPGKARLYCGSKEQ